MGGKSAPQMPPPVDTAVQDKQAESEAKLAKMEKQREADRQKQMEEQNQWQQLAEERQINLN